MATKGTGVFNICFTTAPGSKLDANGGVTAGPNQDYYFQSSAVYADATVAARTGVTLVNADNWEGEEPLVKVDQMILSRKLVRLKGEYLATNGGIKTVDILCTRAKVGDLLGDDKTKNLDGLDVLDKAGKSKGKFFAVRTATRSTFS
jgi:hypothetical protein